MPTGPSSPEAGPTLLGAPVIPTMTVKQFTPALGQPPTPSYSVPESRSNRSLLLAVAAVVIVALVGAVAILGYRQFASTDNNTSKPETKSGRLEESSSPVEKSTASPASSITEKATPTPTGQPQNSSSAKQGVTDTLQGWVGAMRAHDFEGQMSYYAPQLDRYYLQSNVSKTSVRSDIARAYARYQRFDVRLSNIVISVDPGGTNATATFDKTYTMEGNQPSSGSVQETLWLNQDGGRWLITGIRDIKVYYRN